MSLSKNNGDGVNPTFRVKLKLKYHAL